MSESLLLVHRRSDRLLLSESAVTAECCSTKEGLRTEDPETSTPPSHPLHCSSLSVKGPRQGHLYQEGYRRLEALDHGTVMDQLYWEGTVLLSTPNTTAFILLLYIAVAINIRNQKKEVISKVQYCWNMTGASLLFFLSYRRLTDMDTCTCFHFITVSLISFHVTFTPILLLYILYLSVQLTLSRLSRTRLRSYYLYPLFVLLLITFLVIFTYNRLA